MSIKLELKPMNENKTNSGLTFYCEIASAIVYRWIQTMGCWVSNVEYRQRIVGLVTLNTDKGLLG